MEKLSCQNKELGLYRSHVLWSSNGTCRLSGQVLGSIQTGVIWGCSRIQGAKVLCTPQCKDSGRGVDGMIGDLHHHLRRRRRSSSARSDAWRRDGAWLVQAKGTMIL